MKTFKKAKRIWLGGLCREMNIQARFVAEVEIPRGAELRLTGATFYKVYLGGELITHGPSPTASGYARVDVLKLSPVRGKVSLSVEVAGYSVNSYAAVNQESYLIAELEADGEIVAYTGRDFLGFRVAAREQKALRYSGQRHFCEVWDLSRRDIPSEIEILRDNITYLERRAPLPTLDKEIPNSAFCKGKFTLPENFDEKVLDEITDALSKPTGGRVVFPVEEIERFPSSVIARADYNFREDISEVPTVISAGEVAVFECERDSSGLLHLGCIAAPGTRVILAFDELIMDGKFPNRMAIANVVDLTCEGDISFDNFEIYAFKYYALFVLSGEIEVKDIHKIMVRHAPKSVPVLNTDDGELVAIYEAALESFRSNSLGIFMDCPSRERAGWLCDSLYAARGYHAITKTSLVEEDFLENFRLHGCKTIPSGMIPMCYPAEHPSGRFIPQYSLWFILELSEHAERNPNVDLAAFRETAMGILAFFEKYENELSLLEDLPSWNFVEWSKANKWCAGVNFPTNMLYAKVLTELERLFGIEGLTEKAEKIRTRVREISFDGRFFHDQALRTEDGTLRINENISETCQYYAFYFGTATPDSHPELWKTLLAEFGPKRKLYPEIEPSNAFMGALLRLELLLAVGENEIFLSEIKGYFSHMAAMTGTLWEHSTVAQSLNHGFPAFVAALLLRAFGER